MKRIIPTSLGQVVKSQLRASGVGRWDGSVGKGNAGCGTQPLPAMCTVRKENWYRPLFSGLYTHTHKHLSFSWEFFMALLHKHKRTSPQSRLSAGVLGVQVLPNYFQQDLAASLSAIFRKHLSQPYPFGGRMIKRVISQLEISELKFSFTRNVS